MVLLWAESGGPAVAEVPQMQGFGSRMITRSMAQVKGAISYDWQPAGLVVTLRMCRDRLPL